MVVVMYYIKVVPDDDPNADGEIVDVATEDEVPHYGYSFDQMCLALAQYVPVGHHIVQIGRRVVTEEMNDG